MQPERRKHRTPFTCEGPIVRAANGATVAICTTEGIAAYFVITSSSFDELTEALDICRGEMELEINPELKPGYRRLMELRSRIEKRLRG